MNKEDSSNLFMLNMEALLLRSSPVSKNKDSSEANGKKRSFSVLVSADGEGHHRQSDSKRPDIVDDKKWKRVMANRLSAKESRERRKQLLTDLEGSVEILANENSSLTAENAELRKQLASLLPQDRANMPLFPQAQMMPPAPQRFPTADYMGANSFRPNLIDSLSEQHSFLDPALLRHIHF
jgi:hypothetical protein